MSVSIFASTGCIRTSAFLWPSILHSLAYCSRAPRHSQRRLPSKLYLRSSLLSSASSSCCSLEVSISEVDFCLLSNFVFDCYTARAFRRGWKCSKVDDGQEGESPGESLGESRGRKWLRSRWKKNYWNWAAIRTTRICSPGYLIAKEIRNHLLRIQDGQSASEFDVQTHNSNEALGASTGFACCESHRKRLPEQLTWHFGALVWHSLECTFILHILHFRPCLEWPSGCRFVGFEKDARRWGKRGRETD